MPASQLRGSFTWSREFESCAVTSPLFLSRRREKQYAYKFTELSSEKKKKKANVWEINFYLEKESDNGYLCLIREQLLT